MPNVLFFSATWCKPCAALASVVSEMASQFPNITVQKVDIEQDMQLARTYNVKSVPVLMCNGRKLEGNASRARVREFFSEVSR